MRVAVAGVVLTASLALSHAEYSAEIDRLAQELAVAPTAELHLQRAQKLRLAGRYAEALGDIERARERGASNASLSLERGLLHAAAGDSPAALAALGDYLSRGGTSSHALTTRAALLEKAGRVDEAILDLRTAFNRAPTPEVCLELARLEEMQGRFANANATLTRGLTVLGGAATVRLGLISLERRTHQPDAALAQVRAGMAGLPVKAEWRLLAAEILLDANRVADARAELLLAKAELDEVLARRANGLHRELQARVVRMLDRLPVPGSRSKNNLPPAQARAARSSTPLQPSSAPNVQVPAKARGAGETP